MTIAIAVYIFPEVEVLDFAGPFEVFTTASRVHRRLYPQQAAPFHTFTVARSPDPVRARAGLRVLPDYTIGECPQPDVLLVPGGVVDAELEDEALIAWVAGSSRAAALTASVCTGAFVLAKAGLLDGRSATTHWEDQADLQAAFPAVAVRGGVRWVDEGAIVTSAGIAAGIDMSLHLVARLVGADLARLTARQLELPYDGGA